MVDARSAALVVASLHGLSVPLNSGQFEALTKAISSQFALGREQGREEGRRDIYKLIAAIDPHQNDPDGLNDWCGFCHADCVYGTPPHKPDCLWLIAQSLTAPEPVK